jgi:hypothetical protein
MGARAALRTKLRHAARDGRAASDDNKRPRMGPEQAAEQKSACEM